MKHIEGSNTQLGKEQPMEEPIKTDRPFKERVIEGFDRSRLRQEALKAKRKRFHKLRQRYGTMVLGASLAVGGLVPITASRMADAEEVTERSVAGEFGSELRTARDIARGVAGGIDEAIPMGRAVEQRLVSEAEMELMTEKVREDYFKTEVPFGSIIYKEAKNNNIDPELVAAVVQTESQFKPTARSGVGATGLMQLMPRTGKWMGATKLTNPADNVKAGTKYLKYLNERFDGDQTKVLAAYNAGEGNVRRYGGVPPFKETRNYVKKVAHAEKEFKAKVSGKIAEVLENGNAAVVAGSVNPGR